MYALIPLLGMIFCHRYVLMGAGAFLVVETPTPRAHAVVVLEEGDGQFDVAARLHREGARTLLLYRRRPNRLERMGIVRTTDELARLELLRRDIPADDVAHLPEVAAGRLQIVALLGEWLRRNRDQSLCLLCDRFTSRTWKLLLDRAFEAGTRERVLLVIAQDGFDETNWWKSRDGILAFTEGCFVLGFHVVNPNGEPARTERTEDAFRAAAVAQN
jgi:hypothetical protein